MRKESRQAKKKKDRKVLALEKKKGECCTSNYRKRIRREVPRWYRCRAGWIDNIMNWEGGIRVATVNT